MRVVVTGPGTFLGRAVVALLTSRGDEVTALGHPAPGPGGDPGRSGSGEAGTPVSREAAVTGPTGAGDSGDGDAGAGDAGSGDAGAVQWVPGVLGDRAALRAVVGEADAVVHVGPAAVLGAPLAPRRALARAAVGTTGGILAAARDARVGRVVVVTGTAVFGDTGGRTVDESEATDRRTGIAAVDLLQQAHARALAAAGAGQPVLLALPGLLHGPDDPGPIGVLIRQVAAGGPVPLLPGFGATLTHRHDAAAGVLRVLDHGRDGRAYVLGGEPATLGRVVRMVAALSGRPVPRPLPAAAVRVAGLLAPALAAAAGLPPGLPGLLRALEGRTCYARDTRARRELDHTARPLEAGLRSTLAPPPQG